MEVFIARRYEYLKSIVEHIVADVCPNYQVHLTDAKLRLEDEKRNGMASLSVIVVSEAISDREEQGVWLKRLTAEIRKKSGKVFVLMFSREPEKYSNLYQNVSSKIEVICLREIPLKMTITLHRYEKNWSSFYVSIVLFSI